MMEIIKNSKFSSVLQVLLIGYFLISSLNLSNNLSNIPTNEADIQAKESVVWNIFKKMLKCTTGSEEIEDSDYEAGKNSNTIKLIIDYLVPNQTVLALCNAFTINVKAIYCRQSGLHANFYNEIHLPPPDLSL
jgi:hypothetical protein